MALDTKRSFSGNGSQAAAPAPPALDCELINHYLELQVRWLNLQLEAERRKAAESRDETALEVNTVRLWHHAAPTATIVLILGSAIALLAAFTWDDLWLGLSRGQPEDLVDLVNWAAKASGEVRALVAFMQNYRDVLLWILGGGVLLAFKRLAYRSVRSAVVIGLGAILSFSLLAGLVIADIHLVRNEVTPMHVAWRGWAVLVLAVIAGVVLFTELGTVALTSPAAFLPKSRPGAGLRRRMTWIAAPTRLGRSLARLSTPHGWLGWLATLGVVTGTSIALCVAVVIGYLATSESDLWTVAFAAALPLGPVWWLLVLAVVGSSPTLRQPAGGQLRFALFAAAPALSLAVFTSILVSPGAYDASQNLNAGLALVAVLTIEVWCFWFLWAGIAISSPLRIVFLPVVVGCVATVPLYYGLLPFLGLAAILTLGVPWSLWRSRTAIAGG